MRPLIGITVHTAAEARTPGGLEVQYRTSGQYAAAVHRAGGLPLLVPTHPDYAAPPGEVLARLDGLLLSGGGGDHRAYFQDGASPSLRDTNPPRYDYESVLVRLAYERAVPMLGICRGHQTIAEVLGGTLIQDLRLLDSPLEHSQKSPPEVPTHELSTDSRGRIAALLGERITVNSFHRQAVTVPPDGFAATAWASDGLIEAIEAIDQFVIGLQFHPEWLIERERRFLGFFEALVAEARARGSAAG